MIHLHNIPVVGRALCKGQFEETKLSFNYTQYPFLSGDLQKYKSCSTTELAALLVSIKDHISSNKCQGMLLFRALYKWEYLMIIFVNLA